MNKKILIGVAWPYANGPLHIGHLAGVYLPADIFARYQRLQGNQVLLVSGSDCHGTPITLRAEREGVAPQQVIRRYHQSFLNTFQRLGISFDLFTQTYTENHYRVSQDIFARLLQGNYLSERTVVGSYSPSQQRFLPDRFIEGQCPDCRYPSARGDQCDNCGRLQEPEKLIEPHSTIDGAPISFRETSHYFLKLTELTALLQDWISSKAGQWRANTWQFTSNWLNEGLQDRAITRDLEWGVPIPIADPTFDNKRLYVWFDAVIGYYSAVREWADYYGQPDSWSAWWQDPKVESYYFIGKDNIPFHTIIWPAILLGYRGLNLPTNVVASEYLLLDGEQISTSRNRAIWLPDIETRYQPDQLRYYLATNAPESRDSSWSWSEFIRRNNDELANNWGNLVNRVLSLAHRHFGVVPTAQQLSADDQALLSQSEQAFDSVGVLIEQTRFKAALQEIFELIKSANQYLSREQPWLLIQHDRARAATVIYTGLQVIDRIKLLLYPFLPQSSERLHSLLGYQTTIENGPEIVSGLDLAGESRPLIVSKYQYRANWQADWLPAGQEILSPQPLFNKLEL